MGVKRSLKLAAEDHAGSQHRELSSLFYALAHIHVNVRQKTLKAEGYGIDQLLHIA